MHNHDLTSESGARSARAELNNIILKDLFTVITPDLVKNPITALNLINENSLRHFVSMTTGYLGIQNYANLADELRDEDIHKIVNGTFKIKELTNQEVKEMTPPDATPKKKGNEIRINLTEIQDGRYYILQKNGKNFLMLSTEPIKYFSQNPNAKVNSKDLFNLIRNLVAHSISYNTNDSNALLYFTERGDFVEISRMWLRGYSELFAKQKSIIDTQKATTILKEKLDGSEPLKTIQDVNKALSLIVPCFEKSVQKNFRTINNFINYRLQYQPIFYELDTSQQIEFLIHLININPTYATNSRSETLSPTLIYNLQQLVNISIESGIKSGNSVSFTTEIAELEKRLKELADKQPYFLNIVDKLKKQKNMNPLQYNLLKSEFEKYAKECKYVDNKLFVLKKLESSEKDFYDPSLVVFSPVEFSVNLVALMAHNSLAVSSFYDDLLKDADFTNFNAEQDKFFNKLDLNKLEFVIKDRVVKTPYSNEMKCFMLNTIRNAVCHSLVNFQLSSSKQGESHDFRDVVITFSSDKNDMKVIGTVADFYEILSNDFFTSPRKEEIMTHPLTQTKSETSKAFQVKKFDKPKKPSSNDDGSDG